jgi:hypothetical protein
MSKALSLNARNNVDQLVQYLEFIVEPTVDEFRKNPFSERHAYLAAVAIYHSIDRAAASKDKKAKHLREKWRADPAFALIDIVAHDFKHVKADWRKTSRKLTTGPGAVIGRMGFNTHMFNETGQREALASLLSVAEAAFEFVWKQTKRNAPPAAQSPHPQARG